MIVRGVYNKRREEIEQKKLNETMARTPKFKVGNVVLLYIYLLYSIIIMSMVNRILYYVERRSISTRGIENERPRRGRSARTNVQRKTRFNT